MVQLYGCESAVHAVADLQHISCTRRRPPCPSSSPPSSSRPPGASGSSTCSPACSGARIVFLGTPIDDTSANLVVAQLLHLDADHPEQDINLYINSPGGDMTGLFAIYDTMQFLRPEVATTCVGQASSAAAVLLAAGAPGKRFVLPNARVLIHQPHGGAQGQSTDLELGVAEMVEMRRRMVDILVDATGPARERDRGRHRPRLHPARRRRHRLRPGRPRCSSHRGRRRTLRRAGMARGAGVRRRGVGTCARRLVPRRAAGARPRPSAGIAGWVRNRGDGQVEAVFEGESDAVLAMTTWCRLGPPGPRSPAST